MVYSVEGLFKVDENDRIDVASVIVCVPIIRARE